MDVYSSLQIIKFLETLQIYLFLKDFVGKTPRSPYVILLKISAIKDF